MRLLVLVVAIATASISAVRPALAAGANIGLYTDTSGNTCSFSGNAPGAVTAYVVFRPDVGGVNTVQFSAPVPACLGAVYFGETVTPGMIKFGDSQTGVSIVLQGCYAQPVSVLQINYLRSGSTEPCCPYPILPDPSMPAIAASDCAYNDVPTTGVVSHFNADATCACVGNSPPSPPTTPIPINGSSGHSVTATMNWFADDYDHNIVGYDVYLGTTTSPALVASGLTQPSYTPSAPLAELTQHYWRVVVRDALGLESPGPVWTFTTRAANSPPFPPSNPVPAGGATDIALNVTVSWQGADIDADALTYDVYFGTTASPPLVASNYAVPNYPPGPLAYGTTYHWRVVARDDDGLETSGPEWIFTTRPANYPPNAPTTPSPANNAIDRPLALTLTWVGTDADGDPLVFDVYFGTTASPPLVASDLATASFAVASLDYSTTYYWRVVARDTVGQETSGATWHFTTRPVSYPPAAPSSPSPANNSTNRPVTQTIAWVGSDPDGDPLTYDVYFGTAATPPLVASNVATASYAPGTLSFSTQYNWRIVARDSHGQTTTGPTWNFRTLAGNNPPNVPANPSPPDLATNQSIATALTWTSIDPEGGLVRFDVYFGTTFPLPRVATGLGAPYYMPTILARATTYYWRIVAYDTQGATTNGPQWSFTTTAGNSPPFVPWNPSPFDNASSQPVGITLTWIASDPDGDALHYDVYFGTGANPPLVASNFPITSYNPGVLQFLTTYRWRIVVRDPSGATATGPTWAFTTKAYVAPGVPSNPSPPNNGASSLSPQLTWSATNNGNQPLTYRVYFGTTSPPPLVTQGLPNPSYAPGTLLWGRNYYWRVEVTDGLSAVSGPVWRFIARRPGDLVSDGHITLADAECALDVFLWDPSCGGPSAYLVGDVDCSGNVTPGDARCLHIVATGGNCELCEQAVAPSAPAEPSPPWPVISLASMTTREDTLVVRLAVSSVESLHAFGFYAMSNEKLPLLQALRRGATSDYTMLESRLPSPGTAVVGGYTLSDEPVAGTVEFVELRFDMSHGLVDDILINGFVDDLDGASQLFIHLGPTVDVRPSAAALTLHQNHPNPFNPQTSIAYDLPGSAERVRVRMWILDISGRIVATLVNEEQSSGAHEVRWEGRDDRGQTVSSGVYFYVLEAGGERLTRKLVLLK